MASFVTIRNSAWRFTGQAPARHASSPGVQRLFCGTCGSPVAYLTSARPDETDFHAMTLDDPAEFAPQAHTFWAERVSWLGLDDDLPRHAGELDTPRIKGASRAG